LHRGDEPSPTRSAVLIRLSHGHIRIGSFQRLANLGDKDSLKRLVAYALRYYYDSDDRGDAPARLLALVVEQTARLAASYMATGFVHGVLNSDNINISGESFDYGPWRWAPHYDPGFTAAYFDEQGLYSFARQPEAIHWDVAQLAMALTTIGDEATLIEALNGFAPAYYGALAGAMLARLGVQTRGEEADTRLVGSIEQALVESRVDISRFYFDWRGGTLRGGSLAETPYASESFKPFRDAISAYQMSSPLTHRYWSGDEPCGMLIEEVEGIWKPIADSDDWSRLEIKIAAIQTMGAALRGD
jgi:serine/tyrosine/threonine adenylyltransferase